MKKQRYAHVFRFTVLVCFSTLFSACFIVTPIGDAISQGYENTVSYFNGYYNAKRTFGEAEDEILASMRASHGAATQTVQISASAKQKLTVVIEKCSSILSLHPTSSLVDDALFLIGKSYYYQGEFLKAERKFSELLAQYPSSSLALESQFWYVKTLDRLNKRDEALTACAAVVTAAKDHGEEDVAIEASMLMGDLYLAAKQPDRAVEQYAAAAELSPDDETAGLAYIRTGDIFFSGEQYERAVSAYLKVPMSPTDIYPTYYSRLQAAIAYRRLGRFDAALNLVDGFVSDFRFRDYLPAILYERGNVFAASRRRDEAMDEYRYVDTTYTKSESSAKAAFELARVYGQELGDYSMAQKYYSRVVAAGASQVLTDARKKSTALASYFESRRKISRIDSVLSSATVPGDSSQRDSAGTLRTRPLNRDSLQAAKSLSAQELGEVFYSELGVPDSAVYWYRQSLEAQYGKESSARVLFVLAELSRAYPEKHIDNPEELYRRVITDFPKSPYANQSRQFLGLATVTEKSDPAESDFLQAESMIESKEYERAVEAFTTIIKTYPESAFAAKSEYTIGWIYENRLARPDSALVRYKGLVQKYSRSPYAAAVQRRLMEVAPKDSLATDSTKAAPSQKTSPVKKGVGDEESPLKEKQKDKPIKEKE